MFTKTEFIDIDPVAAEELLALFLQDQWHVIKEDDSKLLAVYEQYYIKVFKKTNIVEKIKGKVVGNRSQRFSRGNSLLKEIGLNAPPIVVHGNFNNLPFIIMKEVPGWNVSDIIHSYFVQPSREGLRWKRVLLRELGRTLGEMHRHDIVHGDLRASNVLLHEDAGKLSLYFIDNERTRVAKRKYREKIRNLVQIFMMSRRGFSLTDQFRIFSAYYEFSNIDSKARKIMERDVLKTLDKRLRRRTKSLDGTLLTDPPAERLFSYYFE